MYLLVEKDSQPTMFYLKGKTFVEMQGLPPLKADANIVVSFSEADNTQFIHKELQNMTLFEQLPYEVNAKFVQVK